MVGGVRSNNILVALEKLPSLMQVPTRRGMEEWTERLLLGSLLLLELLIGAVVVAAEVVKVGA